MQLHSSHQLPETPHLWRWKLESVWREKWSPLVWLYSGLSSVHQTDSCNKQHILSWISCLKFLQTSFFYHHQTLFLKNSGQSSAKENLQQWNWSSQLLRFLSFKIATTVDIATTHNPIETCSLSSSKKNRLPRTGRWLALVNPCLINEGKWRAKSIALAEKSSCKWTVGSLLLILSLASFPHKKPKPLYVGSIYSSSEICGPYVAKSLSFLKHHFSL